MLTDCIPDGETLSLAGLLHDIGKTLLLQFFAKEYHPVIQLMEKKNLTFIQAEKALYSIDHAIVGCEIAKKWSFPPNLRAAIEHHHNPENAGDLADFASVIATANIVCRINEDDKPMILDGYEPAAEACEGLYPLSEKAYTTILRELDKQMQFFENFIDRMEAFRRPSPILEQSTVRGKKDSGIWKLPGEK